LWKDLAVWGAMAVGVYGAICAAAHLIILIRSFQRPPGLVTYLVLVKDQADQVEGVVRSLAAEEGSELLLVDLGSTDESLAILQRLALDLDQARLVQADHRERKAVIASAMATAQTPLVVMVDLSKVVTGK